MKEAEKDNRESTHTVEILLTTRQQPWVVDIQDEVNSWRVALGREPTRFGSSKAADVTLADPTVSAVHCTLSLLGAGVCIRDEDSKNGVFVGAARVKEAWGTAGTTITIGRSTLVVWPGSAATDTDDLGPPLPGIAGASPIMRQLATQVRRLANYNAPVLIAGESGTGKELIARALHDLGGRKSGPYIPINVAALPRELVESELFGHERGAFTGASARRAGAFADAEGGTLFLDEIGDLPLDAQPKLLRALDGYEVRKVGASGSGKRGTARVVAATHAPLEQRVAEGQFRRDLFHRLEAFVIDVPPLRERRGDIPAICKEILRSVEREVGPRHITSAALGALGGLRWPGNVRELRNILYRACDLSTKDGIIDAAEVDQAVRRSKRHQIELEPDAAQAIFEQHGRNMSAAARAAGIPRTSFRKILTQKPA